MNWKTTRIKLPPVVPTGWVELKLQWLLNFKLEVLHHRFKLILK